MAENEARYRIEEKEDANVIRQVQKIGQVLLNKWQVDDRNASTSSNQHAHPGRCSWYCDRCNGKDSLQWGTKENGMEITYANSWLVDLGRALVIGWKGLLDCQVKYVSSFWKGFENLIRNWCKNWR